jgi:hypothetical protein
MSAPLREDLVLDLEPGRARALQHLDGANHAERIAETRVGIDQEGQGDGIRHRGDVVCHLGQRRQPDVRRAEMHVGDPGAGHVAGLEPEILDDAGEEGVGRSRHQRRGSAGED